jgi:uncharacterized protein (TIGR03083 family)
MQLAATEYDRCVAQLRSLDAEDWSRPTDCAGWDVKAMAAHMLGMAEMAASVLEMRRQMKSARRRGGEFVDALTAIQVEAGRSLPPIEIVKRFAAVGPKAARARRRAPGFVRHRVDPEPQPVGDGSHEPWTFGYVLDVILTRDPWMHRTDIARATGCELELTADHDGALVADVVQEWAHRHGQPYSLTLSGPAGGQWSAGVGGPHLEMDAVDFCRVLSGRGTGEGLLTTRVPF